MTPCCYRYVTKRVCQAEICLSSEGREVVEEVEEVDGKEKLKKVSKLWDVDLCQVSFYLDYI